MSASSGFVPTVRSIVDELDELIADRAG